MHAPILATFSLVFLPLPFFLSLRSFLLLVSYYSPTVGYSPFLVLPFLGPSLWVLTTLLPWVPPFKCFSHWVLLIRCFFSLFHVFLLLPFFPPPLLSPFFLPWLPPFYSELIQWDFSLLPLELYQLFLVCCEHPFKITHPPIGCPYHCSEYVSCTITYFMTKFSFFCSCCIPLPLGD